jgi:hypothetical protein
MDDVILKAARCLRTVLSSGLHFALIGLGCTVAISGGTVLAQRSEASGRPTNSTPDTGVACIQAPAGTAHWWSGDGSPMDIQGERHGAIRGKVAYASGKVGEAFSFDGTNGVVEASIPFRGVDGWVLAAWVYWKGPSQAAAQKGEAIFYHGDPSHDGYGLFIIGPGW